MELPEALFTSNDNIHNKLLWLGPALRLYLWPLWRSAVILLFHGDLPVFCVWVDSWCITVGSVSVPRYGCEALFNNMTHQIHPRNISKCGSYRSYRAVAFYARDAFQKTYAWFKTSFLTGINSRYFKPCAWSEVLLLFFFSYRTI
jgi:hypothetical protein